ncbi:nucleotidyltransferase domain-containing protein [Sphingomonas sp. VNH70]|uniref:nucleotidyltransferase domain-containing protein n=1 Tax=Sphingomonas silueang TaxID=3156617 RepID=UPI0032B4A494
MLTRNDQAIPADVRTETDVRLAAIEAEHGVRLLFAVESGSRAWGFPSPDSDYDVRFVYVRPRDAYLALTPPRDVIEQPIVDDIDLNGWDIRKALGLLLKSNAIVGEWIGSPIRYRPDHPVVAQLAALADAVCDPHAVACHYAKLGRTAAGTWLDGDAPVPVKRYFYALRPALAIRWMRAHASRRPPMDLVSLLAGIDLPEALVDAIAGLVAAKASTAEQGSMPRVAALDAMIRDELARASDIPSRAVDAAAWHRAEALFLELVNP